MRAVRSAAQGRRREPLRAVQSRELAYSEEVSKMTRLSHVDIENRVDDEEELSRLRVELHEEEEALAGMTDWAEAIEVDVEYEAELAEHLSAVEISTERRSEVAALQAIGAAIGQLAAVRLRPPIAVQLVREGREVVLI